MLNAYMAYDRALGAHEYAFLVVAPTARQAKKISWSSVPSEIEFLDFEVRRLWDRHVLALADPDKLARGESHVVDSPQVCESCGFWNCGITTDNTCGSCDGEPGEKLKKLYREFLEEQGESDERN